MPRRRCPARAGRTPESLLVADASDVPACLIWPGPHGPCEDCVPEPTLRRRAADWIRERLYRRR